MWISSSLIPPARRYCSAFCAVTFISTSSWWNHADHLPFYPFVLHPSPVSPFITLIPYPAHKRFADAASENRMRFNPDGRRIHAVNHRSGVVEARQGNLCRGMDNGQSTWPSARASNATEKDVSPIVSGRCRHLFHRKQSTREEVPGPQLCMGAIVASRALYSMPWR